MISSNETASYSILDLGFTSQLVRPLPQSGDALTPEMINTITDGVAARTIMSGQLVSKIYNGKTAFDNTQTGLILGIDTTDNNTAKLYIGNTTNYLNWTGSALVISGSISAGAIDIGSGFHVDASGNVWWGASATYAGATIKISSAGSVSFTTGSFSGDITGGTITIGTNAFHVDSSGNLWWGSSATYAGASIKISSAGSITFTTGTFSGSLSAVTGSVGALTVGGALTVSTSGSIASGQSAYNTGVGYWLEYNAGTPRFSIGNPAGNYMTWDGTNLNINSSSYFGQYDGSLALSGASTYTYTLVGSYDVVVVVLSITDAHSDSANAGIYMRLNGYTTADYEYSVMTNTAITNSTAQTRFLIANTQKTFGVYYIVATSGQTKKIWGGCSSTATSIGTLQKGNNSDTAALTTVTILNLDGGTNPVINGKAKFFGITF